MVQNGLNKLTLLYKNDIVSHSLNHYINIIGIEIKKRNNNNENNIYNENFDNKKPIIQLMNLWDINEIEMIYKMLLIGSKKKYILDNINDIINKKENMANKIIYKIKTSL